MKKGNGGQISPGIYWEAKRGKKTSESLLKVNQQLVQANGEHRGRVRLRSQRRNLASART